MATLKLEIVTPEEKIYSEDVDMVTLPGSEGELGVYPKHVPLLTTLKPGELRIIKSGREIAMAIGEGFVEIKGDSVSVLTDMALESEKIDIAAAEASYSGIAAKSTCSVARQTSPPSRLAIVEVLVSSACLFQIRCLAQAPLNSLGIIAGNGVYPQLLADSARKAGVGKIIAAAFTGETDPTLEQRVDLLEWMRVGQLNRLLKFFRAHRRCFCWGD